MKKIMNAPDKFVDEMLDGLTAAHPFLVREGRVIRLASAPKKGKVGIVSGGGTRLEQLVVIDDKVLSNERQGHGAPLLSQMIESAVKEGWLGEDRNRRGAAALVGSRDRRRIVVHREHAS